jgi:Zn-dependent M28 family amino/carboxypeptidase
MIKITFCALLFCCSILTINAQITTAAEITELNAPKIALAPLRFLASDELMGRNPNRPEINVAARYISEAFRSFGLKEVDGIVDYFQPFTATADEDQLINGKKTKLIHAKNVMGWVEGTDPILKNEFIVLSSHYDHLGVTAKPKMEEGKLDSIYNGARDNAIGSTAVIDAARYFAIHPAKRSILFITYSAEEMGLLGSKYFALNPPLPLKQIVYNLNIDNASYNDTTAITLVGLDRTTADDDIRKACTAFGLSILPDPIQGRLFYGSDNLPLAEQGIPAPTFSLGMKHFDETILNRYHQLSDEVENFNLNYAMKFINCYILAAKNIADNTIQPKWKSGDEFEEAWKSLHQTH